MKIIATNKKAFHDNEIIKTYEAGIILTGSEIKSIREQTPSIKGAFAIIRNNEIFLLNANIPEYKHASTYSKQNYDPTGSRKLLLHKKEIRKISQLVNEQRLILFPTKIYWSDKSLVKVEIAAGKPLKKYDLREKSKEKAIRRNKW